MADVIKRGETYYIRYDEPRGADGRRKQKMLACKGMNKRQAEQRLRDILTNLHNGAYIAPSSMTFSEYLHKWLDFEKEKIAPQTHERYVEMAEKHIIPALGALKLDKIKPLAIQEYCSKALKSGRVDGKGGLAPKTVRNLHGMIHASLAQAVKWQLLSANPADAAEPPRAPRKEIRTANAEDIAKLWAAAANTKYRIPILIALATGMRRGEVVGVKWDDFDAGRKILMVRRSLTQTRRGVEEKETKTGRARVVMIPDSLITELQAHRKEQELRKSILGDEYVDEGWICADLHGERLSPKWLGNQFTRMAQSVGVGLTLHGLRHTQATTLIMAGVPVKVVSERLGHSTVTITQDIYAHVMPHMQQQAADVMEEVLSAAKKQRESGEG